MRIVADENIPLVRETFSRMGEVTVLPGRRIDHAAVCDASVLLVRSVTPVTEKLLGGSAVRFVASTTIGIEHVDLPFLRKNDIAFAFAPGSNANSVAEYVIAALLHMTEKTERRLEDCTLGIVGVGNIGSIVHRFASSLGIRCLLNDPPRKRQTGDSRYIPLSELLGESDFVTVHVPLTREGTDPTFGMINREFLRRMRPGAVLINTSRGRVADETSLREFRDHLGGLVLDVWYHEPSIDRQTCRSADIATPHIAGYSFDGKINGTRMAYKAACDYFKISPAWTVFDSNDDEILLDLRSSADPLRDAVFASVPLIRDDGDLRRVVAGPADKIEQGFDALRADYPRRLEFRHYRVLCDKRHAAAIDPLTRLGFHAECSGEK